MFKVCIAGSRGFNDYKLLRRKMIRLLRNYKPSEVEIVSGGATGADQLGERFAEEFGCKIKSFIPDWNKYGRVAGHCRNANMCDYSDVIVCFYDGKSRGTGYMIQLANSSNKPLRVIKYNEV